MNEIVFEVTEAVEGGYDARAVGHSIFTQGNDWTDLKAMVKDAVLCHFDYGDYPAEIRLLALADEANAWTSPSLDCAPTIAINWRYSLTKHV